MIRGVPRGLVPVRVQDKFIISRKNHINRMIKNNCRVEKTGALSIQKVTTLLLCNTLS